MQPASASSAGIIHYFIDQQWCRHQLSSRPYIHRWPFANGLENPPELLDAGSIVLSFSLLWAVLRWFLPLAGEAFRGVLWRVFFPSHDSRRSFYKSPG